jgi:hypothetical protein
MEFVQVLGENCENVIVNLAYLLKLYACIVFYDLKFIFESKIRT